MRGTFRFYENGVVVAEDSNLVTTEGRRAILRYLSRRSASIATALGVGVGSTTAAITDKTLEFEINRSEITGLSADFTTKSLVYKTTIPAALGGVINEVGLWSRIETGAFSSKVITSFDNTAYGLINAAFDPANVRVGANGVKVTVASNTTVTATVNNLTFDISGYTGLDEFAIATYNSNSTQFVIRFKNDTNNYVSYTKASPAAGYSINRFTAGTWTTTGAPDLRKITSIELAVTAGASAATLLFDAMRVEDRDLDPDINTLVTHAVLTTPYIKTFGVATDVEYILDIT